jgi:hypothetical protein
VATVRTISVREKLSAMNCYHILSIARLESKQKKKDGTQSDQPLQFGKLGQMPPTHLAAHQILFGWGTKTMGTVRKQTVGC